MTKAEQKKAVQFTRMCKFWRTNECKMGADCSFAHETAELRPSPKPCFEFSKTGSCKRGQACRFVHSVDNMKKSGKAKGVPTAMEQPTSGQNLLAVPGAGVMCFAPARINTPQLGNLLSPPLPSMMASLPCLRPPPGLEDMGRTGLGGHGLCTSVKLPVDGDSRRSSFSEISLSLEHVTLPIPKAADREQIWAEDVATQSLTSTMALSTTPSNFSEAEQKKAVQFTRMCKFWRTNECKMGFVHSVENMKAKNAVKFTRMCKFWKTNECKMGADCCRFVHEVVEMKTTDKFVEVQRSTVNRGEAAIAPVLATYSMPPSISAQWHMAAQLTAAQQMQQFSGTPPGPVCAQTNQRLVGLGALMEPHAQPKPNPCLRPPPGLECFVPPVPAPPGLLVDPEVTVPKTGLQRTADSRRSSLNDISLDLECVKLPLSKADMEGADDSTVATEFYIDDVLEYNPFVGMLRKLWRLDELFDVSNGPPMPLSVSCALLDRQAPIELEDIAVLRTELRTLREEYEVLSRDLRSTRRSLASARGQRRDLRQKVADREEETSKIYRELGCAEEDVLALQKWRQLAKEEAKKAKEIMQGIESERSASDIRIADLKAVLKRQGRPDTAKALEAEATRSRREALDEYCARMQLLRDYIAGRLPIEREALAELLAPGDEPSEVAKTIDTNAAEDFLEEMNAAHARVMKNLIDTSNSIIDKKNHTWKRINKGLFLTSIMRPERCALAEHPTIRDVLDAAEALCRDRQARNAPIPRPRSEPPEVQAEPDRPADIPKEASEVVHLGTAWISTKTEAPEAKVLRGCRTTSPTNPGVCPGPASPCASTGKSSESSLDSIGSAILRSSDEKISIRSLPKLRLLRLAGFAAGFLQRVSQASEGPSFVYPLILTCVTVGPSSCSSTLFVTLQCSLRYYSVGEVGGHKEALFYRFCRFVDAFLRAGAAQRAGMSSKCEAIRA
ncbi:unnamed protein product [Symbiodinium sp. KB8]|nr:unnamed protein product [Symbiodinium sp. KB8]